MYQLILGAETAVLFIDEAGTSWTIPFDPANTDYQAYLAWLEDGNEPLPPDSTKES